MQLSWELFLRAIAGKTSAWVNEQHAFVSYLSDMISYNGKKFRPVSNTENGETSAETIFHYQQEGEILSAAYAGGKIRKGHLLGIVDEEGRIEMCYHQVNDEGKLMTGRCSSTPEILPNGKVRLHEVWEWTSGDKTRGVSVIEEL